MKILITSECYKGSINGVVTSTRNLEDSLTKMGHEVRVLTVSEKNKTYKEDNAYYIRSIPTKIYENIRIPTSTVIHPYIDELVDWGPDIIHSQSEFFTFTYAKYIKRHSNALIIHTFHTLYEQYVDYLPLGDVLYDVSIKQIMKLRLDSAAAVIAPTKKTKRVLEDYGVESPIHIIPTGINLEKYRKKVEDCEIKETRKSLGIKEHQKVLIVLCRLGYEKNISELLYGLAHFLWKSDETVLMIVGDGPAKADLMKLADELNIKDKVIFTGMVDPAKVPVYYSLSDVFVSASTSETQGLTYIEALATGLPLVCRKDECLEDLIVQGENGYRYEKIPDLTLYVKKVLAEIPNKSELSKKISEQYTVGKFAEDIMDLYEKVLNERELDV